VDQLRCLDIRQRQPANAPARRTTAPATPPKIHGDDEEDRASAASTTAGSFGADEVAPLAMALEVGEASADVAVAVGLDGDGDAAG
jgi:hypothetical protein